MSEPCGVVQRFDYSDTIPRLFHRTRSDALLAELEFDWSLDQSDAYVFPTFAEAEQHVAALAKAGVEHCHAFVVSAHAAVLRERELRHASALAQMEASVAPDEDVPKSRRARVPKPLKERVAIARKGAQTRQRRHIAPAESFEQMEKRHLA